jgi:hypothetical protein
MLIGLEDAHVFYVSIFGRFEHLRTLGLDLPWLASSSAHTRANPDRIALPRRLSTFLGNFTA